MIDLVPAVAISVVSCWCYAAAAVRQERLARAYGGSPVRLSRRLGWWWSVLLTCLGAGLHVVALRFGPLTLVQPLGVLTLVFAVPMSAVLLGRRPPAGEQRGVLVTVGGLAGLLLLTASSAPTRTLGTTAVLEVSAIALAVLTALIAYASVVPRGSAAAPRSSAAVPRSSAAADRPIRRGLSYAAAAGIASGIGSALAQTVTVLLGEHGWLALLSPAALGVAVFAPGGLLLAQAAYRDGLGAPLAVVIIANPLTAGLIGITLLGEHFYAGVPGMALAVGCAGLVSYGVALLAVHASREREPTPVG